MHKRNFIVILLILYFTYGLAQSNKKNTQFVTVKDAILYLNGNPYYFTGVNYWYGCYLGSPGATGNRERLKRELDILSSLEINNLRILAASEGSDMDNSLKPSIQNKPGEYDEQLLEGLDYFLAEMAKRNMKAVLFLNNFWEWSGGFFQYLTWVNNGKLYKYSEYDWWGLMGLLQSYYANNETNKIFKDYIFMIINRTNKFTNTKYKDDPTIMSWELANEPRAGDGTYGKDNIEYFYNWVNETAGFIHKLDSNHLVTSGSEGLMGCAWQNDVFTNAFKTNNIDYIVFHLWPKNWDWFNAKKFKRTLKTTKQKSVEYINEHISFARKLNKPVVMEEFGLPRDIEKLEPASPVTARNNYLVCLYQLIYDSASTGAPIFGTNVWSWAGEGRSKNPEKKWETGDEFIGDPPQEPQGLNSIFDCDTATLIILKNHAVKMKSLSDKK